MVRKVSVTTGCRLHFGLVDLQGDLGRVDGGVGVGLSSPGWRVEVTRAKRWQVHKEARKVVDVLKERVPRLKACKVDVKKSLPRHVGLGAQTQLSLAVASAISILNGRNTDVPELARMVSRGGTSGIGVAVFQSGGLILDGGHCLTKKGGLLPSRFSKAPPPPVLGRYHLPRSWRFVVAIPPGKHIEGRSEGKAFKDNTPIPRKEVGKTARIVLVKLLPAVVEGDIGAFGEAVNMLQRVGFKRIENQIQGRMVGALARYLVDNGAAGAGLSSFGPATFAVVDGDKAAKRLSAAARRFVKDHGGGKVFVSKPASRGATVRKS